MMRRHCLSPISDARSVDPTMSVNSTVVSSRWRASGFRGMRLVSATRRGRARSDPGSPLQEGSAGDLRLEGLERIAAGPAEVSGTAQRGSEGALQDGVLAAA